MTRKLLLALLLALLLPLNALAVLEREGPSGARTPSRTLALTGIRLIDGTGAEPVEDAVVLIRDERILAVGPAGEVEVPEGARRLELPGLTLLPGLMDAHVHFGAPQQGGSEARGEESAPGVEEAYARFMPGHRQALLEHGVTSIKSASDSHPWIVQAREAVVDGPLDGPRLFVAGPLFTAPGGHPVGTIFRGHESAIRTAARQVDDPEQAREEVRKVSREGVDFIKVVYDSGHEKSPFGRLPTLEPQVLEAIIDEAHAQGLRVFVHWGRPEELRRAVELGADGMEHAGIMPLSDEHLALMVEREVPLTPTLVVYEVLFPPVVQEISRDNVRRFVAAGGRIVAGTDVGNPGLRFGESLHQELELLVEAGLTPMQALQSATLHAAWHLGLEQELGTVEAGKLADLIAVEGDPLEDIRHTRQVRLVIQNGRVLVDQR